MLTYPSDPLPHIVCPMDEDAIPPHTFCSAPPQSEPPPPLLSLSSITPSCSNNGTSGHRRSGRIKAQTPKKQSVTDSEAVQRPTRQTPSKRQRDTGSMVQVSYSEQPRVESSHGDEKQNKEGCGISFSAEQQDIRSHQRIKPAAENVEERFADTTKDFNATRFTMEACEGLTVGHNVGNPSDPKGWMIGPLFQSFRSKMASLTEIVMSPVKLFRASSPPPSTDHPEDFNECEAAGTSDMDVLHPVTHKETWSQDTVVTESAQNTSRVGFSKKLSFDVEMSASERGAESSVTHPVPFQHVPSPLTSDPLRPSECVSASSHESEIITSAEEQTGQLTVRLKPRKCAGGRRRIISKTLVSEVRKESELDVIDEEIRQINLGQLNKTESHNSPSSSLSPSDSFSRSKDFPHLGAGVRRCIVSCELLRPNIKNIFSAEVRTVKTELNPPTSSAARAKREHREDVQAQDSVKRKRLNADQRLEREVELKPARKGPAVLTRANKKEKDAQGMFAGGDGSNTQTKASSDLTPACGAAETSVEVKSSGSRRRLKAKLDPGRSDEAVDNRMDLETTVNISQSKQEAPPDALIRPEIKQLQILSKKPLKRKSPKQAASSTKPDVSVSTSSAAQLPAELSLTDSDASQQEESRKGEPSQASKRPRKTIRGANKSPPPAGSDETKICNPHMPPKEEQCEDSKQKTSVDPVYFEMTPSESPQPEPPRSQPVPSVDGGSKEGEKMSVSVADEVFSTNVEAHVNNDVSDVITETISEPVIRSTARGVTCRPRRVDKSRRRCRVLHSRTRKGAEGTKSITMDDADLTARSSQGGASKSLLRSYSCPEIHSLGHHDAAWTSSLNTPQLSRTHTPQQHPASHSPFLHHIHKSPRRARRHTVCSLEVEREIAPLCLRKEVYPSRRSVPYDGSAHHLSPIIALSPTTSLKALATCFLSSPLAFLSKKESRGAASSPSSSSPLFSPSSSSSSSVHPLSPSTWRLPGFLQRSDSSGVPLDSSSSVNPLVCDIERREQSEEEEDDGGDTSSSSQEFEDVTLREEKSLSDSEIKVVKKLEERGKVSSIRIRKALPKPQNNLTPMGLPKPVRLKKKEFSLEEIYTNKNFSKPPESRLETIFEVPLNRKNGSESWFGQRRLKRVLEFLEVGEVRKPKKPLVGAGKAGNSRTRRGGFPKDEPSLSPQDVDSLLCAKLDQLNLWLMHDQRDS